MKKILLSVLLVASVIFANAQLASPVLWSFTSKKIADKTYEVYLTATIQNSWHLYSQNQPKDAINQPTVILFNKTDIYSEKDDELINNLNNIKFLPGAGPNKFSILQDSIIREIHKVLIEKENLSITQKDKKVTILFIEVNSVNELFSKIFCENLAKETSNFYIETKSKKAKINVDILQKQVDSVRNNLDGAISSVASEADNVYNMNPAFNIKGAPSKKKQIDVTANTAILTELVKQTELAKVTLRKETPLIQVIDRPILPLPKERFGKAKGIVSGGILAGFLIILFLLIKRILNPLQIHIIY